MAKKTETPIINPARAIESIAEYQKACFSLRHNAALMVRALEGEKLSPAMDFALMGLKQSISETEKFTEAE